MSSWDTKVKDAMMEAYAKTGLTQRAFAAKVGVSDRTVRRALAGNYQPTSDTIDRWFEACRQEPRITSVRRRVRMSRPSGGPECKAT